MMRRVDRRPAPCCRMLLVTEDSGKQAIPTVEALVREILKLAFERTRLPYIDSSSLKGDALDAARGNAWKGKSAKVDRKRTALVREIAATIRQPRGFVVFHFDGDCTWKKSHEGTRSENHEAFEKVMREPIAFAVRQSVTDPDGQRRPDGSRGRVRGRARRREAAQTVPNTEEVDNDVQRSMERLLLLVPFWSIEAWVYQNADEAITVCREKDQGSHVETFEKWAHNRGDLDEMESPKTKSGTCLGQKFNAKLAENGYPARDVYEVNKSFAKAVDGFRACEALHEALEDPPSGSSGVEPGGGPRGE